MTMFAEYLKALEPDSLLEVVPENLMKLLMRGFYYSDHRGITLRYKAPIGDGSVSTKWYELEPEKVGRQEIENDWNPFCRFLRRHPHCDAACRGCDSLNAERILSGGKGMVELYHCHLRLVDLGRELHLAERPMGVLFAGQIAEQNSTDDSQRIFESRLSELFAPALLKTALIAAQRDGNTSSVKSLKDAIASPAETIFALRALRYKDEIGPGEIARFQEVFGEFCTSVQKLVDDLYESKLTSAGHAAVIKLNECFSHQVTDKPDAWTETADQILLGLENVIGGRPLFLLVRRESEYRVMAVSPKCALLVSQTLTNGRANRGHIKAAHGFAAEERKWTNLRPGDYYHDAWRTQLPWIVTSECWTFRIEQAAGANAPLSVIFVALEKPRAAPDKTRARRQSFIETCADALAYHAHMGTLFERQQAQQEEYARRVSWVGHHLKTPLQNAFATLSEIRVLGNSDAEAQIKRQTLCDAVVRQLQEAQADALMLQVATKAIPERVDVRTLLKQLLVDFDERAKQKNIFFSINAEFAGSCIVSAVAVHLRAAFSNLFDNALKYSFENQRVEVRLDHASERYLEIKINNSGRGFYETDRPTLFQYASPSLYTGHFQRRPGHGIGLSQASELLKRVGGTIDIESRAESTLGDEPILHRTTVTVVLPRIQNL
jgi:signal transduction histidine kinase